MNHIYEMLSCQTKGDRFGFINARDKFIMNSPGLLIATQEALGSSYMMRFMPKVAKYFKGGALTSFVGTFATAFGALQVGGALAEFTGNFSVDETLEGYLKTGIGRLNHIEEIRNGLYQKGYEGAEISKEKIWELYESSTNTDVLVKILEDLSTFKSTLGHLSTGHLDGIFGKGTQSAPIEVREVILGIQQMIVHDSAYSFENFMAMYEAGKKQRQLESLQTIAKELIQSEIQ